MIQLKDMSLLNIIKPKKTEILDNSKILIFKSYSFNKLFSNNIDEVYLKIAQIKLLDSIYQKANEIGYYLSIRFNLYN